MSRTSRLGWSAAILLLYLLHQDLPFWRTARPLVFGFLPVGLAYHAGYCVAVAALMWALTRWSWPAQLERAADRAGEDTAAARGAAPESGTR
jgi:hypothetical protein